MELSIELVVQLLGFAGLGVVAWWRIGRLEALIREQNGRIGSLERWKERREGYREGWGDRETGTA